MIEVGIGLLQDLPPARLIEIARLCEELGYDTLWYANEKFYRDPYVGLAVVAQSTRTIRLGTYVADPYTLHPALIGVAISTLDELSGGRAILLLGAGGSGLFRLGIRRERPVRALHEAIEVVRRLLSGERVDFRGETVFLDGVRLAYSARPDIPIYVASRGDQILTMAGEHADGVMIATYATPQGVRHALDRVKIGAQRSGRHLEDLSILSRVDGWIDADGRRARDAVRPMVARFLSASYPDRNFVRASGVEVPPELEEILARRNREEATAAAGLVPDELVEAFTWAGTPEQVAGRVASIIALGVRRFVFMPHPPPGESIETGIRAFAQEVMPRLRTLVQDDGLISDET